MQRDNKSISCNVHTAASLYSLGKLSIGEAAKIAAEFRYQFPPALPGDSLSPQSPDNCAPKGLNADFPSLKGPARQFPARDAIMALAHGLTRDTADPFKDIFEVQNFILSISDFLSEAEFERAAVFVVLGMQQSQLFDSDPEGRTPESVAMREEIRQAAIEYINDPLNKAPAP